MRKADLRLILRRRNLACDHHAVEGGSEAFAAASWSGDVSRPALKRAHEHDYTVHDYNEAKRGRRFGRRQALHLYSEYNDEANIFISCPAVVHLFAVRCISLASTVFLFGFVSGTFTTLAALSQRLRFTHELHRHWAAAA